MQWKRYGMIAAILIVISGGAYAYWITTDQSEVPLGFATSNGRIEAERIDVATKLAGQVAKVLVTEGQWVEAGDLVAQMDAVEIDAQLHQAEAAVMQARQQKLQAEALLNQRNSELALAQSTLVRIDKLAVGGHASQEQLEQAKNARTTAQAGVEAAKAGIDLATATIAAANAGVDRLRSVRTDADLVAPHSGRVQYILAKTGEVVAAGGKVVTLTDLTDIYMTIYLPAGEAGLLAIGSQARIILDPIPQYVIPATVTFVASTAQFTPKTVETSDERERLMFKVKLTISPELLEKHQEEAKAGVAGVGYVNLDETKAWPESLAVKLPQ